MVGPSYLLYRYCSGRLARRAEGVKPIPASPVELHVSFTGQLTQTCMRESPSWEILDPKLTTRVTYLGKKEYKMSNGGWENGWNKLLKVTNLIDVEIWHVKSTNFAPVTDEANVR